MKLIKPCREMLLTSFENRPLKFFLPSRELSQFVEIYWIGVNDGQEFHKVDPDGVVDIVISTSRGNAVFCFGTSTSVGITPLEIGARYFGIRFYPGQTRHFFKMNVSLLTDHSYLIQDDLFIQLNLLGSIQSPTRLINEVNKLLLQALRQNHNPANKLDGLIRKLSTQPSGLLSDTVAQEYITQRSVQRWFKEHIGISPKKFQSITRINTTKNILESRSKPALSQLAIESGFSDQSHFQREFKQYFGISPLSYAKLSNINEN